MKQLLKGKASLTVGIPAFNEEANIGHIIKDLLDQNNKNYNLKAIIINSDGSTDNTLIEVKKIKSNKIILVDSKKRMGRTTRQNQIMKLSRSEVLVLVDADTLIKDKKFLDKIALPIISGEADLTSVRVEELETETFLENILETSMKLKKYIFENISDGNNLYTCHGRARAFSKKLYKSIKFTDAVAEDAYSYLYCISRKMKYQFVPNTEIFYKLPVNYSDHKKQSIRFIKSKEALNEEFGKDFVTKNYRLPFVSSTISLVKFFIKKPLNVSLYIALFTFMKLKSLTTSTKITWEISQSSKKLRKRTI